MITLEYPKLSITRHTKGGIPNLPFLQIKNSILGKEYNLSLVFPTLADSIQLHKKWKQKKDPVNVLAFPLDHNEGEIIITLSKSRNEARKYGRSYHNHLIFLFIHACLHLKGMDHGDKMEEAEIFWYTNFSQ
jgi:probable rRNA maturation factor